MRWPRAWTTASSPATAPSPAQHSASGEFFVFCCQWCCSPGTRTFKALKTRSSHFPLIQAEKIRTVESYLSSIKAHSCQWPWLKSIFELLNIEFRQIWNWIWSKLWKLNAAVNQINNNNQQHTSHNISHFVSDNLFLFQIYWRRRAWSWVWNWWL